MAAIPDHIAWWRLKYNLETETVDVLYPTMTDLEATAQLVIDRAAAAVAEAAAEAARIAALP